MTLTSKQTRWIERCAKRLQQLAPPPFTYVEAVSLAFELYRAWPLIDSTEAAEAYFQPEQLAQ
jgi:hypothetical protein